MARAINDKRRQHYVPQFYLRGFQYEKNMAFVLDEDTNRIFKNPSEAPVKMIIYTNRNLMIVIGLTASLCPLALPKMA